MAKEKPYFREMLAHLQFDRGCKDSMNITETAKFFGENRSWVYKALSCGALVQKENGDIPIGSIANYLLP